MSVSPPTRLKNPALFKPFEMFVEMYGLPAYQEMDPTIFIALTYTLMFGIMFGDVGQGLCLLIGGFVFYRIRHMNLGAILSLAGIWSTVFGFMYGSVFGFEDILKPVWMRPMDNIMTTLMLSIGFGMFLILAAMVLVRAESRVFCVTDVRFYALYFMHLKNRFRLPAFLLFLSECRSLQSF